MTCTTLTPPPSTQDVVQTARLPFPKTSMSTPATVPPVSVKYVTAAGAVPGVAMVTCEL